MSLLDQPISFLPKKEIITLADEIAPNTSWTAIGLSFEESHGFVIQTSYLEGKHPNYLSAGGYVFLCQKLLEELGSRAITLRELFDAMDRKPVSLNYLASKYRLQYDRPVEDLNANHGQNNQGPNNNNQGAKSNQPQNNQGQAQKPEVPDFSEETWFSKPVPTTVKMVNRTALPKIHLSIFVVNDIELKAVLREFTPLEGSADIATVQCSEADLGAMYKVGKFGALNASLTQTPMGPRAEAYVSATIRDFKPKLCVYIGVAWGADQYTQSLGDVMVSESVSVFGSNDKAQGGQEDSREVIYAAGQVILNLLKLYKHNWTFKFQAKQFDAIFGRILSGGLLLNDSKKKAELLDRGQNHMVPIIGGDMEALGLANSVFNNISTVQQWVMVKGICDWADGSKHKGFQPLAAATATSFVLHALQDPASLTYFLQ